MLSRLKAVAKRSKWAVVAVSVAKDLHAGLAARHGVVESTSGSTHQDLTLEESLEYIDRVFGDYLTHGQVSPEELQGKRVLEIGPGDNLGVALRFAATGAEKVVSIDRFASRRDEARQASVYRALSERDGIGPELVEDSDDGVLLNPARIEYLEGIAAEQAAERLDGPFDLIVSRAVMEHVFDPVQALAAMDSLLAPGGTMIHRIDFRDHGMFTGGGQHPLTFLTIPDPIYRQMSKRSGRPNRRLVDWYRSRLSELGYNVTVLIARLVGATEELDPPVAATRVSDQELRSALETASAIRSRLLPRFREADPADLAIASAIVVARKDSG